MTQKKILVVGATGTVGSELVDALVKSGEKVKAATRNPDRDLGNNVEPIRYDYDDPTTFDAALEGTDRIFYLSRGGDAKAGQVARPLFEKAADAGVTHIVNMSVMGVDVNERNPLGSVEAALEQSGVTFTHLRPNWFMQNFTTGSFSGMVQDQGGLYLPAADASVSFVDVRDIAAVAAKILHEGGHQGATYTLTGGEAFNHGQVAKMLSEVMQREIQYAAISDDDMRAAMEQQQVPAEIIDFMVGLFKVMRAGHNASPTDDVRTLLGRAPRPLAALLQEHAQAG